MSGPGGDIYIGVNRAGMHKTRCIVHPGISVPYVLTPVTFVTYMLRTRNKRHCAVLDVTFEMVIFVRRSSFAELRPTRTNRAIHPCGDITNVIYLQAAARAASLILEREFRTSRAMAQ